MLPGQPAVQVDLRNPLAATIPATGTSTVKMEWENYEE